MNKQTYRLVFNKARGCLMAVAETATSSGKAASGERVNRGAKKRGGRHGGAAAAAATMQRAMLLGAASLWLAPMYGEAQTVATRIVADPAAARSQQATVVNASNGVVQVNIQTPSSAGVSRNTYSQFDVGRSGAILNNSRNNVQTQLGGWVQANPWLATGTARVILNEVTSGNPSQLQGYLEVGGQRAEVVVANPAGIAVNGGGFINAASVTLTTGTPQYSSDGALNGFRVQGGAVSVTGQGFDASTADYAQIFTRALAVNAAINAQKLRVVTGVNDVSTDGSMVAPSAAAPQGSTPNFAIDVGQLGGMYAGKIFLVANEAGVGVRNAGTLGSTGGALTLSANGQLSNTGTIIASTAAAGDDPSGANLVLHAAAIANSGSISARNNVNVSADQVLQNAGLISAGREAVASAGTTLDNSGGTLNGQRLDVSAGDLLNYGGKLQQSGAQDFMIAAASFSNSNAGGNSGLVGAQLPIASSPSAGGATTPATPPSTAGGSAGSGTGSDTTVAPSTPTEVLSTGQLRVTGSIDNAGGQIVASGATDLSTSNALLNSGAVNVRTLSAQGAQFSNDGGKIQAQTALINAVSLSNLHGQLQAETVRLQGGSFNNQGGTVTSTGSAASLSISLTGALDNRQGALQGAQDVVLAAGGGVNNQGGTLLAQGNASIDTHSVASTAAPAGALLNDSGSITAAAGNVVLHTGDLSNGALNDGTASGAKSGSVYAGGNLSVNAGAVTNSGTIAAAGSNTVNAQSLGSNASGVIAAGLQADGSLAQHFAPGGADLQVTAAQGLTAQGQNLAAGDFRFTAASGDINVLSSQTSAQNVALNAANGNINAAGSHVVAANQALLASANNAAGTDSITTDNALVQAQTIALQSSALSNRGGRIEQSGSGDQAINARTAIDNTGGVIASNAEHLSLSTATMSNTSGRVAHTAALADPGAGASLAVHADTLNGQQGTLESNNALVLGGNSQPGRWDLSGGLTQGQSVQAALSSLAHGSGARLVSASDATLNVDNLTNNGGTISAAGNLTQSGSGAVSNVNGHIAADGNAALSGVSLDNTGGVISAGGSLAATQGGMLANVQGQMIARQAVTVSAASIDTSKGQIVSLQDGVTLAATASNGGILNRGGLISAQVDVTANAPGLIDNSATGRIGAQRDIQLGTGALNNAGGQVVAGRNLSAGGNAIANAGGLLQAGSTANVQAANFDNSNTLGNTPMGLSAQTISVSGGALDNTQGRVQSGASTQVNLTGALTNRAGRIEAGQDLSVAAAAGVDNRAGILLAQGIANLDTRNASGAASLQNDSGVITAVAGNLDVHSGDLSNQLLNDGTVASGKSGSLYAGGNLSVNAGAVTNSGTIAAAGGNAVNAQSLSGNSSSVIAAGMQADGSLAQHFAPGGADLQVTASQGLTAQGQNLAAGDLRFTAASGDVNVSSSQTSAQNVALNAANGNINAAGSHVVAANQALLASANNAAGTDSITTDNAQVLAARLALQTSSLSNRGGSLQQSGSADQAINARTAIDNTGGAIASNAEHLILSTATLTNTNGQIVQTAVQAAPALGASLAVHADTLNGQGGTIATNNALQLGGSGQSGTWDVSGGRTQGQTVHAALASFNNSSAKLVSSGDATLNVDSLNNNAGTIAAGGNLTQSGEGALTNINGHIAADGNVVLSGASLDNSGGMISASGSLGATQSGNLNNALGRLIANQALGVSAANIVNDHGVIESVHGGVSLNATASNGAIANQGGQVVAQADAVLNAAALIDNSAGGQIGAQGNIGLASAALNNSGGQIVAGQNLNTAGASGVAGSPVNTVGNQHGLLQAGQTLSISAASIDNSNTANTTPGAPLTGLQGNDIQLAANTISNASGEINAGHDAQLLVGALFDNSQGLTSAVNNLLVQDSATVGNGGAARQLQVVNSGGTLIAGQDNTIIARDTRLDGALRAGRDLTLDQSADINHTSATQFAANRNVTLRTAGDINNGAALQAGAQSGATLTLDAANVNNQVDGTIGASGASGANTAIHAANSVTNRGLIDGVDTRIDAATLSNTGSGRIYGDHIGLSGQALQNQEETVNGVTHSAVIAARQDLDIGIQNIVNREGAMLYSGGDMRIGGTLDATGYATGQASSLTNSSAEINSAGNLTLNVTSALNTDAHFATVQVATMTAQHVVAVVVNGVEYGSGNYATNFGDVTQQGEVNERRVIVGSNTYPFSSFPADVSSWAVPAPWSGQNNMQIGSFGKVSLTYSPGIVDPNTGQAGAPVLNYPPGHPIWAKFASFGVQAPPPAPTYVGTDCSAASCTAAQQTAYDAYQAQLGDYYDHVFPTYQAQLDGALNAYNSSIDARKMRDWYVLQVTRDQTSSQVDTTQARPAHILAGGEINGTIPGALVNDNSQIIAGGALNIAGGGVRNTVAAGRTVTTDNGTLMYTYVNTAVGINGGNRYYNITPDATTTTTPSDVSAAVVKQYAATGGVAPSIAGAANGQDAVNAGAHGQAANAGPNGTAAPSGAAGANLASTAAGATSSGSGAGVGGGAAGANPGQAANGGSGASTTASGAGGANAAPTAAADTSPGAGNAATGASVIRTLAPTSGIRVSNNSLYRRPSSPSAGYLVETDPAFTNNQQWLGSDYMLQALGTDPNTVQKRLGDGFYEQHLLQQQVAQLTGRRFLGDYTSEQQEYRALMDAGITYARQFNLRPGVALTDAQVAALTSDIVWLVNETVIMPDGTTTTALVPKLYAHVQAGDLQPSGALLSGDSVNIRTTGDVVNTASVQGRRLVSIAADNISNLDGGTFQAGDLLLSAQQDINNVGGTLAARHNAVLDAGRDINVQSTTVSNQSVDSRGNTASSTQIARLGAVYVGGGNDGLAGALAIHAGRDVLLQGALLANEGTSGNSSDRNAGLVAVSAGHNVELGTVATGYAHSMTWDGANHRTESGSQEAGTQISGQDVSITARGGNIDARAASVNASGALMMAAGQDLHIEAGESTQTLDEAHRNTEHGFLKKKTGITSEQLQTSTAQGSSLHGQSVDMVAGQNLVLSASDVSAERDVNMSAGRNLSILSAEEVSKSASSSQTKKSGLAGGFSSGVISLGYGKSSGSAQSSLETVTQHGSSVVAQDGSVKLKSGETLQVVASDIAAKENLTLIGKNVDLAAAQNTSVSQQSSQSKSSGFSAGVTVNPLAAFKDAYKEDTKNTKNGSFIGREMGKAEGAFDGAMAAGTAATVQFGSHSKNSTQSHAVSEARASSLTAGKDLTILATDGSITSQGAQMSAEGNALLLAKDSIKLDVAHTTESRSQDSRTSGFSFDNRSAQMVGTLHDKGNGDGATDTVTGTKLSVGGSTTMATQTGDITLTGASVVSEGQLAINAARNLTISSAQDTVHNANQSDNKAIGKVVISDTERFSGYHNEKHLDNSNQVTQVASNVSSLKGDVNLRAGEKYTQVSSNVLAGNDVNITAKSIDITALDNTGSNRNADSSLKIGAFARVSSPLIDLVNNVEAARKSDGRLQAMQGMAAAANGYQAAKSMSSGTLVKGEAGIGFASSSNSSNGSGSTAVGSTINGGGNVNLTATGGDIHATGATLSAGKTLSLDAAQNIVLDASQSTLHSDGKNHSSGVEAGVGFQVGAQTGVYAYVSASVANGHNNSDATVNNNTQLKADTINIHSKGDTTLKGATATANTINADVGGKLAIESLQDTSKEDSTQTGAGIRVQVAFGNAWEASGNVSQAKSNGSYAAVGQQSGLFAGSGGYHVKADTIDLKGGAIASTNTVDSELTTNKLTTSNLENRMEYSASNVSLAGSVGGGSGKGDKDAQGNTKPVEQQQLFGDRKSGNVTPGLPMMQKGSDSSTTYATVTDGKITIGGVTTNSVKELGVNNDASKANIALDKLPDMQKLVKEQQAMSAAAGTVIATAKQMSDDFANSAKKAEAVAQDVLKNPNSTNEQIADANRKIAEAQKVQGDWGAGGIYSRALNAGVGLLTGSLAGQASGQIAANVLAPTVAKTVGDIGTQLQNNATKDADKFADLAQKEAEKGNSAAAAEYTAKANQAAATAANWGDNGIYRVGLHAATQGMLGNLANGLDGVLENAAGVVGGNLGQQLGQQIGNAEAEKLGLKGAARDAFINAFQQTGAVVGGMVAGAAAAGASGDSANGGALLAATHGGEAAGAVDTFNRKLHDADYKNAKRLAKLSEGEYSEKQIRDALRWSGIKDGDKLLVEPGRAETFAVRPDGFALDVNSHEGWQPIAGLVNDIKLQGVSGDQPVLKEVLPAAPDAALIAFIQKNTGDKASPYVFTAPKAEASPYFFPVPTDPNAARDLTQPTRASIAVDGVQYHPLRAECPLGCFDATAWAIDDAGTRAYGRALNQKLARDAVLGLLSLVNPFERGFGFISASGRAAAGGEATALAREAGGVGASPVAQAGGSGYSANDVSKLVGSSRTIGANSSEAVASQFVTTPTKAEVRELRDFGLDSAQRRTFFEGGQVIFEDPATTYKTATIFQLGNDTLHAGIYDVITDGSGALTSFASRSASLGNTLGVRNLELFGADIQNPTLASLLTRRGFQPGAPVTIDAFGFNTQVPTLRKTVPLRPNR